MKEHPFYKAIASGEERETFPLSDFKGKIVWMTPSGYIKLIKELNYKFFRGSTLTPDELFKKTNPIKQFVIRRYSKEMKKGKRFPIPYIHKVDKSWDGVHRVHAAKEAGFKYIPIFMMR